MKKKDIFFISSGAALLVILIFISLLLSAGKPKDQTVLVATDKAEYRTGDALKVNIENHKEKQICFSSCYPYYLQKKNGSWEVYEYEECKEEDKVQQCINPGDEKTFELVVPKVKEGSHRLSVSACVGCRETDKFRAEETFFSNSFSVE